MKTSNKVIQILLSIFVLLPLAGCFKGEVSLDIHPNGSVTFGGSYGLTRKAKLLLNMGNSGIEEEIFGLNPGDEDVRTSMWVDGDYEWVKAEIDFESFDKVNTAFKDVDFLNHFSLSKKKGLFQDQIILDAEINFSSDEVAPSLMGFSVGDLVDVRFIVRMPGEIQEKNGMADINDPNRIIWQIDFSRITPIHAKSVTWNYLNIGIIAAGALLCFILLIILIVFLIHQKQKKSLTVPSSDTETPDQSPDAQTRAGENS